MSRRFEVAVIGARTPVGEALLELLTERRLPAGELSALVLAPEEGEQVAAGGLEIEAEDVTRFDFRQVQIAFLADRDPELVAQAERAADSGCAVIDASGYAWLDSAIPVVVPELNAAALAGFNERGIVANPSSLAVALALVLAPLQVAGGLRRVSVTGLLAASDAGRIALEDLARETTALLSARHYERRHFPRQIAFNLQGQIGMAGGDGRTEMERRLVEELQTLMGLPELVVSTSLVQAPTFYGHAASVEVQFERPTDVDAAAAVLRSAPGVELIESPEPDDVPTPVTDATQSDAVRVGRLRQADGSGHALNLWLTADNIRRCAALNALGSAEILIRDYL